MSCLRHEINMHGQDETLDPARDRAARHRGLGRFVRILYQDQAARLFDGLTPTVRSAPAPERVIATITMPVGDGAEEAVNRRTMAARLLGRHRQDPAAGVTGCRFGGIA